jgi:hypothetical protein
MLFMGNGEHSGAMCWKLASTLVELLIDMGGWQQPRMSTEAPLSKPEQEAEQRQLQRWHDRAEFFLRDVAAALGYEFKGLKREKK